MHTSQATAPAISCFALPTDEAGRRIQAAEEEAEAKAKKYNHPTSASHYGLEILWHPAFSAEYVTLVSKTTLHEMGVWCENVDSLANDNKPLDLLDYCYLADCLREGLASQPTPLAALRLKRALALVKHAGAALLAAAQAVGPHLASEPAVPATLATAA